MSRRLSGDDRREHLLTLEWTCSAATGSTMSRSNASRRRGCVEGPPLPLLPDQGRVPPGRAGAFAGRGGRALPARPRALPLQQFDQQPRGLPALRGRARGGLPGRGHRARPRAAGAAAGEPPAGVSASTSSWRWPPLSRTSARAGANAGAGGGDRRLARLLGGRDPALAARAEVTREQVHALLRQALLQAFAASAELATDTNGAVPP